MFKLSRLVYLLITFAAIVVLLLIVIWCIGELRHLGYIPANLWTNRAAGLAQRLTPFADRIGKMVK